MTENPARGVTLHCGDCLAVLPTLAENSLDSCVTDPPYHLTSIHERFGKTLKYGERGLDPTHPGVGGAMARLSRGFMGQTWDGGDIAFRPEVWREVYRVLKPGAHLLAFGGTRTYHRMACAIEDAGFEIRDCVFYIYGSGFPKSHDVSKGIDRAANAEREIIGQRKKLESYGPNEIYGGGPDHGGVQLITAPATNAARQWEGWGTALKPAVEPIILARKPLSEATVAANVLKWGTGALNIDGCRVATDELRGKIYNNSGDNLSWGGTYGKGVVEGNALGRWPANLIHDGSEEVAQAFPETASGSRSGEYANGTFSSGIVTKELIGDSGSAARFFYQVKQDDELCHSISNATDAGGPFALQSDHVVSALSNAVAQSMPRSALRDLSFLAHSMSVSGRDLRLLCESVTEAIQRLERRCWLGLEQENITVRLGRANCVAIRKPIGTTTITLSLWMSARCVEVATFSIIETNAEVGALASANRVFYTAKADFDDRLGSKHPTVKPLDLIQYLIRLVTPRGGTVLDPFAGTGTAGEAAIREGMQAVLIEREAEYQADIRRRLQLAMAGPDERLREAVKARGIVDEPGPLFAFLREAAE